MSVSLIAAMASNRVIGKNNQLPWHLKADLQRFKQLTMGAHLIMGRKTFDSVGRPLPGRTTVVVTRDANWAAPAGVLVAHSVEEALDLCRDHRAFIAGGQEIYTQMMSRADQMYLTVIDQAFEGDARFPEFDAAQWELVERESQAAGEDAPYGYEFLNYRRR